MRDEYKMCCEQENTNIIHFWLAIPFSLEHHIHTRTPSLSLSLSCKHLTLSISLFQQFIYVKKRFNVFRMNMLSFGFVFIHSFIHPFYGFVVGFTFNALKPDSKQWIEIVEIVYCVGVNRMADWLASCLVSLSSLRLLFFLIKTPSTITQFTHPYAHTHKHAHTVQRQFKFRCVCVSILKCFRFN